LAGALRPTPAETAEAVDIASMATVAAIAARQSALFEFCMPKFLPIGIVV
jgi:hypothetical protein